MKITLVQIDLVMGSRILLHLLQDKGYDVKALQINIKYIDRLKPEDLKIILDYVDNSEVVGLSFNTFYALIAEQLALFLKDHGIRYIVTGGNHATALPDEVITYSDVVIKYEAEITLLKVLEKLKNGGDLSDIKGIVYKTDGKVIHNPNAPDIIWDLDSLPFQSVDPSVIKYFNLEKKLYTPEIQEIFPFGGGSYFILGSRGCPFDCTYCSNSLYHSIDKKFVKVRKRSVDNIVAEMEYALTKGFGSFYIADDNFFSFTLKEIEQFSHEYKKRINRPFSVVGVNPNNFRSSAAETKLKLLLDCGLSDIRIGVQSGSDRTLKLFKRGYNSEEIPKLLSSLEKNRETIWEPPYERLNVALDFICDSIWETKDDKIATIKLAQKVLSQYSIFFYTLVYLPGTNIYTKAIENRWIDNNVKDIYLRGIAGVDDNIYNRILFLIAVTKERGVTLDEKFIDHILSLADSDPDLAKTIVDTIIKCINGIENHHHVNLNHAALHPYLTGFNEWTKQTGEVGRKVLFRSYHEPYG
jgi:radical SAM superfamily enzyme YgiQ (UPF0313 family)